MSVVAAIRGSVATQLSEVSVLDYGSGGVQEVQKLYGGFVGHVVRRCEEQILVDVHVGVSVAAEGLLRFFLAALRLSVRSFASLSR